MDRRMITAKIKRRGDIWYFDDYFKSLRKNENEIAKPIRQFVSDPKRYLFSTRILPITLASYIPTSVRYYSWRVWLVRTG